MWLLWSCINLITHSAGGRSGPMRYDLFNCIICHPIRILLGPWLVKVRSSSISESSLVFDHYCLSAIGLEQIECSGTELVTLQPPSGQSCGSFMAQYISTNGGYLTNPDVTSDCQFCAYRTTDEWMGPNFNIYYKNHWRDFGIFWAYIVFNVRHLLLQLIPLFWRDARTGLSCVPVDVSRPSAIS